MLKSKDYLIPLLENAPAAWALIRANELRALEGVKIVSLSLDIGCGDGLVASIFLDGKRRFDWGVDLSKDEIAKAKQSNVYKNTKIASVYDLPFPDNYFQTVFSNSVVEHIDDLDCALSEITRVLKKNGTLIITTPTPYLTEYLGVKRLLDSISLGFLGSLYGKLFNLMFKHYNLYKINEWEKIFKKHSLKIQSYKYYHSKHLIRIHEFLTFLAIPQHFVKRFINFWPVIPFTRNVFLSNFKEVLATEFVPNPQKEGGSVLLVTRKIT